MMKKEKQNELYSMLAFRKKKLIAELKTKRKNSYPCKKCSKEIEVGSKYMSVKYNDGFLIKLVGAFHEGCYKAFYNEF